MFSSFDVCVCVCISHYPQIITMDNNNNDDCITINIPYRMRLHGACGVRVNKVWWHANGNSSKSWQVLGVPNERKVKNYVIYGDPRYHPEYMHVSVYTHYNPEKIDAILDKSNQIDHTHHDPTDNCIQSLRPVSRENNLAARRPPKRSHGCSSAFKGVSKKSTKSNSKWVVEYNSKRHMTKRMRTACLPTQTDAAKLYNMIVQRFEPEYGYQNSGMIDDDGQLSSQEIEDIFLSMLKKHSDSGLLVID